MLDAARLEPLQLPDDLGRGAEQGRIVEHEGVRVVLDPGIALGLGAARQIADVLQHLPADGDRALALGLVADDVQPPGDADRCRIVMPADPAALICEGGDALDDEVGRCNLVQQQVVAFARRGGYDRPPSTP